MPSLDFWEFEGVNGRWVELVRCDGVIILCGCREPVTVDEMLAGRAIGAPVELKAESATALALKLLLAAGFGTEEKAPVQAVVDQAATRAQVTYPPRVRDYMIGSLEKDALDLADDPVGFAGDPAEALGEWQRLLRLAADVKHDLVPFVRANATDYEINRLKTMGIDLEAH